MVGESEIDVMGKISAVSLVVVTTCLGLAASAGAQPSGIVIAVVQQSEADGETGKRVLMTEAPVFSGDHIITGPIGQAQGKFLDDT